MTDKIKIDTYFSPRNEIIDYAVVINGVSEANFAGTATRKVSLGLLEILIGEREIPIGDIIVLRLGNGQKTPILLDSFSNFRFPGNEYGQRIALAHAEEYAKRRQKEIEAETGERLEIDYVLPPLDFKLEDDFLPPVLKRNADWYCGKRKKIEERKRKEEEKPSGFFISFQI